jgi:hypothetical protein
MIVTYEIAPPGARVHGPWLPGTSVPGVHIPLLRSWFLANSFSPALAHRVKNKKYIVILSKRSLRREGPNAFAGAENTWVPSLGVLDFVGALHCLRMTEVWLRCVSWFEPFSLISP